MILFNLRERIKLSLAKRDKIVLVSFFVALLLNVVSWGLLLFNFYGASEYIILEYTIYFGISSLGPWYYVLIVPFIGLAVIVINFMLSFVLYLKYKILSYFCAMAAVLVSVAVLVTALLLIYFNS